LFDVKAARSGKIEGITRRFIGVFLSEALTTDEKNRPTIRLYNAFPDSKGAARAPGGEKVALTAI
jgi:hypothetical protein